MWPPAKPKSRKIRDPGYSWDPGHSWDWLFLGHWLFPEQPDGRKNGERTKNEQNGERKKKRERKAKPRTNKNMKRCFLDDLQCVALNHWDFPEHVHFFKESGCAVSTFLASLRLSLTVRWQRTIIHRLEARFSLLQMPLGGI